MLRRHLTGDEIVVVVQKARPITNVAGQSSAGGNKVRRGDVRHAVVVRTKKEMTRPDGRTVRFDDNACVLLNNKREPAGTRINGVVAAELRQAGWSKILALAPKVV
jgi:ribosomal protein L14